MGCGASIDLDLTITNENPIPDKSSQTRKSKKKNQRINDRKSIGNEIYQKVKANNKKVKNSDLSLLVAALCSHFLLYKLSKSERLELIECVQGFSAQKGDYIFKQGDPASMFFIISQGKVGIEINGNKAKTVGVGEYFGELALLYTAPRSASVKALTNCQFWCLSQTNFKRSLQNMVKQNYQTAKTYIGKIKAFDFLNTSQKDAIAYNMHSLKYEEGQVIFKEGQDANSFYVIVSGDIEIEIAGKKKIVLKPGDSFGENSFKGGEIRHGTAKAMNQACCLSIGREAVRTCLGGQFEELRLYNVTKWALKRSKILKGAPNILIEKLIPLVEVKPCWKTGQRLIEHGQDIDTFIICLEGRINQQEPGKIFFEDLILKKKPLKAQENLVVEQPGWIGVLPFSKLQRILGGSLETRLSEEYFSQFKEIQEMKLNNLRSNNSSGIQKSKLTDFTVLGKLGEGQFGKVYMVERIQDHSRYALKCIEKNMIIQNEMEIFIQQERAIMAEINFPLIVQLETTFKDQHFIYILMEFISGGDFFDILREIGLLSFNISRFYLACFLVSLEYLRSKHIVYRDFKPENAVVSEDGYLHVVDMGTAKFLDKENGFRTFTIIGTPHYMAPEIIQGKGYGFASDIWSLGVIFYEMVCGYLPYGQDLEDPYDIYKEIDKEDLAFPKSYKDARGKEIAKRLMARNPEMRAVQKFSVLKQMDIFEGFDWESLLMRTMKAPFKPKKKNYKEKKYNNITFIEMIQKEKKLLGKPQVSKDPDWDKLFETQ